MLRLFGRSARIVPGPLKAISVAGGSPVSLTALALTAAALAAGLVLIPHLSRPRPAAPSQVAEVARPALATPRKVALVASEPAVAPSAAIKAHTQPAETVTEAPTAPLPVASAAPVVERALFQLDALPVLEANGEDLDIGTIAPKPASHSTSRRTPGSRSAALTAQ